MGGWRLSKAKPQYAAYWGTAALYPSHPEEVSSHPEEVSSHPEEVSSHPEEVSSHPP